MKNNLKNLYPQYKQVKALYEQFDEAHPAQYVPSPFGGCIISGDHSTGNYVKPDNPYAEELESIHEKMEAIIKSIPDRRLRGIMEDYIIEGRDIAAIAFRHGYSINTIKSRIRLLMDYTPDEE